MRRNSAATYKINKNTTNDEKSAEKHHKRSEIRPDAQTSLSERLRLCSRPAAGSTHCALDLKRQRTHSHNNTQHNTITHNNSNTTYFSNFANKSTCVEADQTVLVQCVRALGGTASRGSANQGCATRSNWRGSNPSHLRSETNAKL